MKNETLLGLISVAAFGMTALLPCTIFAQSNESTIQGTWRLSGETPKDKSGRSMSWYLEWTFANGKFLQTGYPPISQEGKYRVLSAEQNKLTLELYGQKGNFGAKDRRIEVAADEKGDGLKIDGKEGFVRMKKR